MPLSIGVKRGVVRYQDGRGVRDHIIHQFTQQPDESNPIIISVFSLMGLFNIIRFDRRLQDTATAQDRSTGHRFVSGAVQIGSCVMLRLLSIRHPVSHHTARKNKRFLNLGAVLHSNSNLPGDGDIPITMHCIGHLEYLSFNFICYIIDKY